jgi:hypothetical protein
LAADRLFGLGTAKLSQTMVMVLAGEDATTTLLMMHISNDINTLNSPDMKRQYKCYSSTSK